METHFAPYQALAKALLPHAIPSDDGSHDLSHILRVWQNVRRIQEREGGDLELLAAATLLHDCVAVEKDAPQRSRASQLAAEKASTLLLGLNWPNPRITQAAHAIAAHSFSAGIPPETLEAKILQDADRLDAIGAIGIARCFYVAGRLKRPLFDPNDPGATHRPLDDSAFGLDHFSVKLNRIAGAMTTETGARMALERHRRMGDFLADLGAEMGTVLTAHFD